MLRITLAACSLALVCSLVVGSPCGVSAKDGGGAPTSQEESKEKPKEDVKQDEKGAAKPADEKDQDAGKKADDKATDKKSDVDDSDADDDDGKNMGEDDNTEGGVADKDKAEALPKYFDEELDAREQIADVLKTASENHKQVLLVFGHNWCQWCVRLHDLFEKNDDVEQTLQSHYVTAWVDTAQLRRRAELGRKFGEPVFKHGVPFLVVLAADGRVLKTQETGTFEDEDHYSADAVVRFLNDSVPRQKTAEDVLADARIRAALEDKAVLVQFVVPNGNWCRRLEEFCDAHAKELARDYVPLRIDVNKELVGPQVARRLGMKSESGAPWMAVVNADGDVLITSEGERGNIGFPISPQDIEHFVAMLEKTARHSTKEEIAELAAALRQASGEVATATPQPAAETPTEAPAND